jgi:hypothetical protein
MDHKRMRRVWLYVEKGFAFVQPYMAQRGIHLRAELGVRIQFHPRTV